MPKKFFSIISIWAIDLVRLKLLEFKIIKEELRRIYESGGEIRKLAGEEKSRIFVKGKYWPVECDEGRPDGGSNDVETTWERFIWIWSNIYFIYYYLGYILKFWYH